MAVKFKNLHNRTADSAIQTKATLTFCIADCCITHPLPAADLVNLKRKCLAPAQICKISRVFTLFHAPMCVLLLSDLPRLKGRDYYISQ